LLQTLSKNLSYVSSSPSLYSSNEPIEQEIREPTMKKIDNVSPADWDKLKKMLESNKFSPFTKVKMQRSIIGVCTICYGIPDYVITRYYEGLRIIEKYYSKCIDNMDNNDILSKVQVVDSVNYHKLVSSRNQNQHQVVSISRNEIAN